MRDEMNTSADGREVATLGGGCFWCLDAAFAELQGVEQVVSGYMGGAVVNPSYEQVCSGRTGHAEVVRVTFDSGVITYPELLEIFFAIHDPTTLNRQGGDIGTQYRSAIFYHDDGQRRAAEESIKNVNEARLWGRDAVTEVAPLGVFYPAEAYHQDYFRKNPAQGYCQAVVAPKVGKVRQKFANRLKSVTDATSGQTA